MAILVTGAAGYIGSHCVRMLNERGIETVAIDNLSRGHRNAVAGEMYVGDISDGKLLDAVFGKYDIDCVVHFAAFSLVAESMDNPYDYFNNNTCGTIQLLDAMRRNNVGNIVFSSTAATYGLPEEIPMNENSAQIPINPYGESKLAVERVLKWFGEAYGIKYAALRYFNVAGAHESGDIGEDHRPETHLIPIILSVAAGKRENIHIYGCDYNTPDGTCIRDYIHVCDLINAHIKAYEYLVSGGKSDCFNLGSGGGYSNLEILSAARRVTGHPIPSIDADRRPGDPDILIASNKKAEDILGWRRRYTDIGEIIATAWKWHTLHPDGYGDKPAG